MSKTFHFLPQQANLIKKLVYNGCARPWYVYVETFVPAFVNLVLFFTVEDFADLVRGYGYRRLAEDGIPTPRTSGHGMRSNLLGRKMDLDKRAGQGLKWLLRATEPLEKIGFFFFLYQGVEDFAYNWAGGLARSPYCTAPVQDRPFSRSRDGGQIGILPGGDVTPLPILENNGPGLFSDGLHVLLTQGRWDITWAISAKAPPGGIGGVHAQISVTSPGGTNGTFRSDGADVEGDQHFSVILNTEIIAGPTGANVSWECQGPAVPVGLACDSAHFFATKDWRRYWWEGWLPNYLNPGNPF